MYPNATGELQKLLEPRAQVHNKTPCLPALSSQKSSVNTRTASTQLKQHTHSGHMEQAAHCATELAKDQGTPSSQRAPLCFTQVATARPGVTPNNSWGGRCQSCGLQETHVLIRRNQPGSQRYSPPGPGRRQGWELASTSSHLLPPPQQVHLATQRSLPPHTPLILSDFTF